MLEGLGQDLEILNGLRPWPDRFGHGVTPHLGYEQGQWRKMRLCGARPTRLLKHWVSAYEQHALMFK